MCVPVCPCECDHVHTGARSCQKRASDALELELGIVSCPTWVFELNSAPLEEQQNALNHRTTSSASRTRPLIAMSLWERFKILKQQRAVWQWPGRELF